MKLKELRKQKGLTQIDASMICNVPLRTYKRMENDASYEKTAKYHLAVMQLSRSVKRKKKKVFQSTNTIAVAGTGYVGLSNAIILAQHNKVYAVDLIESRIDLLKQKKSPIREQDMETYLASKELSLFATTNGDKAYAESNIVIIATPTNYDSKHNMFDTSSIESVIEQTKKLTPMLG